MKKDLELYIHIPFCVKKCEYCDFLSHPAAMEQQRAYVEALCEEIRACGNFHRQGLGGKSDERSLGLSVAEYQVVSVFFGGGTPSLLPAEWIREILDTVRTSFSMSKKPEPEISLEANPGTVNADKLRQYRAAGINRLSIGCQSSDNEELKRLGRIHTWEEFLETYDLARKAGFENINVDLMSGLPGQSVSSWEVTLRRVASLGPEHLSAYSLIIEEGTPFAGKVDTLALPDEEAERAMYENTHEILEEYGYEQYEISNYAKPQFACRHNLGYWTGVEYLGLGLGSASMVGNCRFVNTSDFSRYLSYCSQPERLRMDEEWLDETGRMEEFMILGLRLMKGVSFSEFRQRFGVSMEDIYGAVLDRYVTMGFLEKTGTHLRFTRPGISVSNPILAEFLR